MSARSTAANRANELGFTAAGRDAGARHAAYDDGAGAGRSPRPTERPRRGIVESENRTGEGDSRVTQWYLEAVSLPVKIDAQKDPIPALLLFALACLVLWFLVVQARRRDARRTRGKRTDSWSRRPPRH